MAGKKKKVTKKNIKLSKDIIASMADDFRKKLRKLVKDGIKDLTIDLRGVEKIDSVGLGVLIAAHNSLKDVGGKLKIKNVSGDIVDLMKTMRLDQHFEVEAAGS